MNNTVAKEYIDACIQLGLVEELLEFQKGMIRTITPEELKPAEKINYQKIENFLNSRNIVK